MASDFRQAELPEVQIVESPVFEDSRGFFTEVFHAEKFGALGLTTGFSQDSHSRSVRNTLRGLHYQLENSQLGWTQPHWRAGVVQSTHDCLATLRDESHSR